MVDAIMLIDGRENEQLELRNCEDETKIFLIARDDNDSVSMILNIDDLRLAIRKLVAK